MKRQILIALSALLLASTPGLRAADETKDADKAPKRERPARREGGQGEEDKNLSPEERAKRRKEATEKREKRIKELREKKAAGTLTEGEKKQLERLEAQAERAKRGGRRGGPEGKDGKEGGPRKEGKPDAAK